MTTNVVTGGYPGRRQLKSSDMFESAVASQLGDAIRADEAVAREMWSALANVQWSHQGAEIDVGYSFRAAGDLIAAIRGSGNYLDWYCCAPDAEVSERIAVAMASAGWTNAVWESCMDEED